MAARLILIFRIRLTALMNVPTRMRRKIKRRVERRRVRGRRVERKRVMVLPINRMVTVVQAKTGAAKNAKRVELTGLPSGATGVLRGPEPIRRFSPASSLRTQKIGSVRPNWWSLM
jgi:hypothetical protein